MAIDKLTIAAAEAEKAIAANAVEREAYKTTLDIAKEAIKQQQDLIATYQSAIKTLQDLVGMALARIDKLEDKVDKANARAAKLGIALTILGVVGTILVRR